MAIILQKPPLEESWKYCFITDINVINKLEKTQINMEYKFYNQCYYKRTEAFRYALIHLTGIDPGCYIDELSVDDFDAYSLASRNKVETIRKYGQKLISQKTLLQIEEDKESLFIEGGENNGRRALNNGAS